MAEIFSNTFTTNINKVIVAETDKNTQIIIMKNKVELAAVNSTPTTGQYRVTIAETKNCTARLENELCNTVGCKAPAEGPEKLGRAE